MELIAWSLESFIPRNDAVAEGRSDLYGGRQRDEKRREPRFPTNQITCVHPADVDGLQRAFCRILDFSARGMRVRMKRQLEPGMELRVTLRETFAVVTVCYCHAVDGCFDHGIKVNEIRPVESAVPAA